MCDSLLNICPIGDVSMGEPQLLSEEYSRSNDNPLIELVACSGRGKNGALTVLQRTVRPQLITAFNLPGEFIHYHCCNISESVSECFNECK